MPSDFQNFQTADLCDAHPDGTHIADPMLVHFGGARAFYGEIATVKVFEDNVLVRKKLSEPGEKRVLVVDGGGSVRCALAGDQLATLALENGWAGVVINGCVRDSLEIAKIEVGVMALATCPRRSGKEGKGVYDTAVSFAGINFEPGHHLYADADGLITSDVAL